MLKVKPRVGEGDKSFEVSFEFSYRVGEAAKVHKVGEVAFDSIALLIQCFVVTALLLSVDFEGTTTTAPMDLEGVKIAWLS